MREELLAEMFRRARCGVDGAAGWILSTAVCCCVRRECMRGRFCLGAEAQTYTARHAGLCMLPAALL